MADESCKTVPAVTAEIAYGHSRLISVKTAGTGYTLSSRIRVLCEAHGLVPVSGSQSDSDLGALAAAHFNAGHRSSRRGRPSSARSSMPRADSSASRSDPRRPVRAARPPGTRSRDRRKAAREIPARRLKPHRRSNADRGVHPERIGALSAKPLRSRNRRVLRQGWSPANRPPTRRTPSVGGSSGDCANAGPGPSVPRVRRAGIVR